MTTITHHRPPAAPAPSAERPTRIPQYSIRAIVGLWAAAAVPMGVLAWLVAPAISHHLDGPAPLARALLVCTTAGLVWQFVLVAGVLFAEQRTLRWSVVKDALRLHRPRSPRSGRAGGRTWWIVVPLILLVGLEEGLPRLPHPVSHDFGVFMQSDAAETLLHGSWGWFALLAVMAVFNTVLGEELFFRGLLLPRMAGAFGRWDWVANGALFAGYHVHAFWSMPAILLVDTFALAGASKRYGSTWIGIAVHSAQSVVLLIGLLILVL